MKIIKDIRLFKSDSRNEYGSFITHSVADKKLNAIVCRVVMKLRENGFSLGEFDHLYINFTTCEMSEDMAFSDEVDKYHPWYRYCSVRVQNDLYCKLNSPDKYDEVIWLIEAVLVHYFATEDFDNIFIHSCFSQAIGQGENMLMKFKEKIASNRRAVVYLRYLDSCMFYPLLHVYDEQNNLLLEKNMPISLNLDGIGSIQVSEKRITISPRKNSFTTKLNKLIYEY